MPATKKPVKTSTSDSIVDTIENKLYAMIEEGVEGATVSDGSFLSAMETALNNVLGGIADMKKKA